jgi:putative tryptophan/tyrosine transport system substrate-binding protein
MRRREFIALIGGVALGLWGCLIFLTLTTAALPEPQRHAPIVGVLNYAAAHDVRVIQFLNALRDLGYVESKNVIIIQRHADGVLDRLPELAAELVAAKVDLIIALGPAVWAAKQVTTTIPIVIAFSDNPEQQGVVASLARPGGNLTGFSYMSSDLAGKRLELLCSAFARCNGIAVLYNPREPATKRELEETEAGARSLGITLKPVAARHSEDLEQAFVEAAHGQVEGLLVFTHGFTVLNSARIIEMAARRRLPVLYGWREFVEEGGLMSYGPDIQTLVRQATIYVDRILKGEKPSDLPVQQPTRLELVINLKTAKKLGLTIPAGLLLRADEVIE